MTQLTYDSMTAAAPSETQLWGYDPTDRKIVAYQFNKNGVSTKTIDGWIGNAFVSHINENGYVVSLVPIDSNSIRWTIEDPKKSFRITSDCTKTNYSAGSP
jgi:hypothetical protein